MEANNKHYQILIDRLKEEIGKNYSLIKSMQVGTKTYDEKTIEIANDYINYHQEIIDFIKRIDKEVEQC